MKLTALAAAWLAGLALAHSWYDAASAPLLFLALFAFCVALICRIVRVTPWAAFLIGICLLGIWRYELGQPGSPPFLIEDNAAVSVRGVIVNDPEATKSRIKFTLELDAFARGVPVGNREWMDQGGRVLVYAHPIPSLIDGRDRPYYRHGDRLELTGSLQKPEPIDGFDYPAYLESQEIYAVFWSREATFLGGPEDGKGFSPTLRHLKTRVKSSLYEVRRHLARGLDYSMPANESALAQALLLGLRGQLPEHVTENFRQTGTSHILAISGLHLGILLLMSLGLLQRLLGRHTPVPLLLALALMWLYVFLSGAPASVIRAAIMGSVLLVALGVGRPRESLSPALALSAVTMTAIQPLLVSQISFQLSFAAMAGIVLALPWVDAVTRRIADRMESRHYSWAPASGVFLGWLAAAVIISVAATLATFPLVAINFNQIPLMGAPNTILATPLLPFALVSGLIVGITGSIHPLLGQLAGLPGAVPLTALLQLVDLSPKLTFAVDWEATYLAWVWYGLLMSALLVAESRIYRVQVLSKLARLGSLADPPLPGAAWQRHNSSNVGLLVGCVILAAVFAFLLSRALIPGDDKLKVYFFDVGQGDSIFIVTPEGRQVLIDGGPDFSGALRHLDGQMPPWDRTLDLLVATHLDADHSRGLLRVLEEYKTGAVLVGIPNETSPLFPQWRQSTEQANHSVVSVAAGQEIALEEGITLRVLHPPRVPLRGPVWDSNNNGVVMHLAYGDISFLLTADIEAEAERYLARNFPDLESDVLKAAHHGSNSSTTRAFLEAVKPRWAVVSAGKDNQYGHPHPSVMERLQEITWESGIFSTATQGTIEFSTDGKRLWVQTER